MYTAYGARIQGVNRKTPASHFQFVLAGEAVVERNGHRNTCKKGDVQVTLGGEYHRTVACTERLQTLGISFEYLPGDGYRLVDPTETAPVIGGELRFPVCVEARAAEALHDTFRQAQELVLRRGATSRADERTFCEWQLQTLVRQLMLTLATRLDPRASAGGRATPVQRVVRLLSNSLDRSFSLDELASEVGLSTSTLKRRFKQDMGCTVKQFHQRLRIQQGRMWLVEDPDLRLSDLAERLGFHDEFHFSKTFKLLTGQSPSGYRRSF